MIQHTDIAQEIFHFFLSFNSPLPCTPSLTPPPHNFGFLKQIKVAFVVSS